MAKTREAADQDIAALVARASREPAARGRLFELFAPKVYVYLLHQLAGRQKLAERLSLEVFREAFDRLAVDSAKRAFSLVSLYGLAHARLLAEMPSLDAAAPTTGALGDWRFRVVAELDVEHRAVVILRVLLGVSLADTATALLMTTAAVERLQASALGAMRGTRETMLVTFPS